MPILFSSKSPEWGWLSNFSSHPILLDGLRWPSVEHYYQARKYAGTEIAEQIRRADSPGRARKVGQNRSLTPRADWDAVKEEVMRAAIRAKFGQHPRLARQLRATADEPLVHASEHDLFWGQRSDGVGENRLGLILMEIRRGL